MTNLIEDQATVPQAQGVAQVPLAAEERSKASRRWIGLLLLPLGAAGGLAGYYAGIPSGYMIGAMLVVVIAKLLGLRLDKPSRLYSDTGSILLGTFAGALFSRETLAQLGQLLAPAMGVIFGLVVLGLVIGLVLSKFAKLDLASCLFGVTPGGLSEMVAASGSSSADRNLVLALQLLRFYIVLLLAILFLRYFPL